MARILIIGIFSIITSSFLIGAFQDKAKIEALEKSKDRGKLTWYAEMAKAKGDLETVFRSGLVRYAVPRSLYEATENYNVVIAEPVDSKSYPGDRDIRTWYKFRIIEELSTPTVTCGNCPLSGDAPDEMLPLKEGEFLASQFGGEVMVDGIRVIAKDPEFPRFENGRRYLLFLNLDSHKTVATLRMGPWGTFTLDSREKLEPIDKKLSHPVKDEITNQFGDSLIRLRMRLKDPSQPK